MKLYLGLDIGSISANFALIENDGKVIKTLYLRTLGRPIDTIQKGLKEIESFISDDDIIVGVGATGSARQLIGTLVGADVIKNEITAHSISALHFYPDVQTVFEIGGQDSKIIIIRDGFVCDFAMNTICAAGTGSFLDQQAMRLGIPIEQFGDLALKSTNRAEISGRCTVFAESDLIHKQQMGYNVEDLIAGLCDSLVRNYLSNVAKSKELKAPYIFQGGVARNRGICEAFKRELKVDLIVPKYYDVMGAIGVALLVKKQIQKDTNFRGFAIAHKKFITKSFKCQDCAEHCEILVLFLGDELIGCWGSRCGKWDNANIEELPNYFSQAEHKETQRKIKEEENIYL